MVELIASFVVVLLFSSRWRNELLVPRGTHFRIHSFTLIRYLLVLVLQYEGLGLVVAVHVGIDEVVFPVLVDHRVEGRISIHGVGGLHWLVFVGGLLPGDVLFKPA